MQKKQYDYNSAPWLKKPVEWLTTYKPNRICGQPTYWAVTEDNCVLFYQNTAVGKEHYHSPQCNTNEAFIRRGHPGCKIVYFDMWYLPHNCNDYV